MRRVISVCLSVGFVFALVVSLQAGLTAAQSPSGTPSGVDDLQTQVANQQATITALETQVADLRDRLTLLTTGQSEPSTNAASPAEPLAIGETYTNNNWSITVTSIEITPTVDSNYEQNVARGVYCIVYFTIINNGNAPVEFPYDDLQLTSGEGRSYTLDSEAQFNLMYSILDVGIQYDPLQPGLPYNSGIVFDMPADATGLTLTSPSDPAFIVELE